jgi:urease accessory protein
MRPKLLVLDEPTEGIQPSIIKDIGRAIRFLRDTDGHDHPAGGTISGLRARACGQGRDHGWTIRMYVDTSQFEAPVPAGRLQRASGGLRLAFRRRGDVTALHTLFQEGSAKARLPRAFHQPPEAILINTAGGLAGGDRFSTEIVLDDRAGLVVTTQACERVYRSLGDAAEVSARLTVGRGARLDWLPQETILFDGSRLRRRFEVDLGNDAEFLAVEAVLFGRMAMGDMNLTPREKDKLLV